MSPMYRARTLRGIEEATMARVPEKTPAEPSPAIARPKMSMTDPVASAAIIDPAKQKNHSLLMTGIETERLDRGLTFKDCNC